MSVKPVSVRGTELSASDTRERYRQKLARITLDSMVQFVGLLDAEGRVLEINQVALDAAGIKLSDVEGKPFWMTFWWQVSEEVNATLRESIRRAAQGEFVRWDAEIYKRAGGKETIIIDASLMPVKDEHGDVVFITAEGRDITEKKAHEREIARQRQELAQLEVLKTQFFANISHEFRTPLTLTMGPLEDALVRPEALPASNRERVKLAHRNSLRLLKLVNTLLDFPRIEEQMRSALVASQRLAAIVESSADGIVSKDLDGIVTSWNAAAERIFGFKAEEIVGRPITLIIPPELQSEEPVILGKIRKGERIEHFQTVRQTKEGNRIDVSLTVSPVKDKRGNVIGAAKIVRDITEQKKLERALQTTEQLASVGRLAATVAHEINNPLESVTNFVYLAKTSPGLSDELCRYLTCADQELSRVSHIARQTLGFYRDNSSPVWLDVSDAVSDVLTVYQRKLEYKGVKVQKKVETGLKLFTLEGELKQILSNLIANAIDASHEAGTIWVGARRATDFKFGMRGIRIVVADNGIGISGEDKAKLFNPFFTRKKEVGTGLGLWITKELIDKAGGHIRLRSRVGSKSGTVMAVFMPSQSDFRTGQVA